MAWYHRIKKGIQTLTSEKKEAPDGVWVKCPSCNSTYTQEEFKTRIGWGHSTWNEGVKLCKAAGVKRLGIFHHDPDHDDVFMDKLAEDAAKVWDGAFVVEENMDFLVE